MIKRKIISEWRDLVQHGDWIVTGYENIPKHLGEKQFINPSGTLLDRVTAKIYSRYFDNNDITMSIFYNN